MDPNGVWQHDHTLPPSCAVVLHMSSWCRAWPEPLLSSGSRAQGMTAAVATCPLLSSAAAEFSRDKEGREKQTAVAFTTLGSSQTSPRSAGEFTAHRLHGACADWEVS